MVVLGNQPKLGVLSNLPYQELVNDMDEREVKYFVNGEEQRSKERRLTVAVILTRAGFTPASDYELTRDRDDRTFKDQNEEVELHDDERFTATFVGPTPTS